MKFRHEWKHEISYSDLLALRQRLQAVMRTDSHAINGKYEIRSLYFVNLQDQALLDKINGVNKREKFRIRCCNGDTSFIQLEKKSKINGLCLKEQTPLTIPEVQSILKGSIQDLKDHTDPLVQELYRKMGTEGLRPKTIVDYTREAFIYPPGNVRVTFDYNLRTGLRDIDFLNPDSPVIPAENAPIILEVKWDEFLPSIIRDVIQLKGRSVSAFSKYAACRMYD